MFCCLTASTARALLCMADAECGIHKTINNCTDLLLPTEEQVKYMLDIVDLSEELLFEKMFLESAYCGQRAHTPTYRSEMGQFGLSF